MKLHDISQWCRLGSDLKDYPLIGEIDADANSVNIDDLLKIDNDIYAIGVLSRKDNAAGGRLIEINDSPKDCNYEHEMKCPYCGYQDRNSWELSDSEDEYQCQRCHATIKYERQVTVEYNSSPVKPPEIVDIDWK